MEQGMPSNHQSTAETVADRAIKLLPQLSPLTSRRVSFTTAWAAFVRAIQALPNTRNVTPIDSAVAWANHFGPVFRVPYRNETGFSDALFDALRGSLRGFCEESNKKPRAASTRATVTADGTKTPKRTKHDRELKVSGTNIGFATEVYRNQRLGFPNDYGMSTNSKADHACVIFRYDAASDNNQDADRQYDDVTATVELKLDHSSCDEPDGIHLDLEIAQGALGQALVYEMEAHYSLTRQGRRAQQRHPIVVLAAMKAPDTETTKAPIPQKADTKRAHSRTKISWKPKVASAIRGTSLKNQQRKNSPKSSRPSPSKAAKLCCMQAFLQIPRYLGDTFKVSLGRCVRFPENKDFEGHAVKTSKPTNEDNYMEAVAIYLNALTIGLEHGAAILNARSQKPCSLCFLESTKQLRLIASPIPCAVKGTFAIGQGELFEVINAKSTSLSQWLRTVVDNRKHIFCDPARTMEDCLVKISHKTVHDLLVPPGLNWSALEILRTAIAADAIGDVLLACASPSPLCIVTVMKNLRKDKFTAVPNNLPDRRGLWPAFQLLVNNVLLPLANVKVVHTDIRCAPLKNSTYSISNILSCHKDDGTYELRLIDFESLVMLESDLTQFSVTQDCAVSVGHFDHGFHFAHEFLFWQVLWMAFVWSPRNISLEGAEAKANDRTHFVVNFINGLFSGAEYEEFREWVGMDRMRSLRAQMKRLTGLKNAVAKALTKGMPLAEPLQLAHTDGLSLIQATLAILTAAYDEGGWE
jgi:hypothetical protein